MFIVPPGDTCNGNFVKEMQIKLGLFDTDIVVAELWKQLSAARAAKSPEQYSGESVHQWMVRYFSHAEAEHAREDRDRAAFLSELSQAAGETVALDRRLSFDTLAKFACMRGIKVTQERAIASRPSWYEVALGRLLDTKSSGKGQKEPLIQRARHWQLEVLRVIGDLGHDPMKLPKGDKGKAGVRGEVWTKLFEQKTMTRKNFEKAWEQLRKDGQTAEAGS
jgi:hypothetical protein